MTALFKIAAWLATSKVGRAVAAGGALALAVGVAVLSVFSAGKRAERDRQNRRELEQLRSRNETDAEIQNLDRAELDRRARRWMRDD